MTPNKATNKSSTTKSATTKSAVPGIALPESNGATTLPQGPESNGATTLPQGISGRPNSMPRRLMNVGASRTDTAGVEG